MKSSRCAHGQILSAQSRAASPCRVRAVPGWGGLEAFGERRTAQGWNEVMPDLKCECTSEARLTNLGTNCHFRLLVQDHTSHPSSPCAAPNFFQVTAAAVLCTKVKALDCCF